MNVGRRGGRVGSHDAVVVIKSDATEGRDKDSRGGGRVEDEINSVGSILVLDNDAGTTLMGLGLGENGVSAGTNAGSNKNVRMDEPFNERAGKSDE